jgi:hypothetical protein
MTLVGAAAALFLRWRAYIPTRFGPCWVFVVGERWGGVNLGPVILISKTAKIRTIHHEIGHALQNCLWGPLFPFVIAIPSAIRYQLREREEFKDKVKFSIMFDIALCIFSFISLILIIFNIKTFIILSSIFIEGYLMAIVNWLDRKEIPKYAFEQSPSYDDIWFEGQATKTGEKFRKERKEEA